jgi:hypothetical protein
MENQIAVHISQCEKAFVLVFSLISAFQGTVSNESFELTEVSKRAI